MTAVPALKRGLEILNLLNQHEMLSLEQIANQTSYPKASILRMLETLGEMGLVSKIKELKQYRALSSLMPREHGFEQRLQSQLHALAESCDACVEWYDIEALGLRIAQRFSAPENEVQVFARVGYVREWQQELEAVSAVGLAFMENIEPGLKAAIELEAEKQLWVYDQSGDHRFLSENELQKTLKDTQDARLYCDPFYNDNGVKRMAAPVFQDGQLVGIAALAMSYRPQLDKQISANRTLLIQCVQQLEK